MMTVEEEVARAVQIANAPQKVNSRGAPSAEEVTSGGSSNFESNSRKVMDESASKTAAPSIDSGSVSSRVETLILPSPPPEIDSPGSVTVQRSPAFSLFGNSEVDVEGSSGDNEGAKKTPVKLKRPRDAQLEGTVTCTDCGIQIHWASLARHRKMCHLGGEPLLESGGFNDVFKKILN